MKFKKFFAVFGLTSLAIAGALFVSQSAKQEAKPAKATTDLGIYEFYGQENSSNANAIYALTHSTNDIPPTNWPSFIPDAQDLESGVFVDGVRLENSRLQKANTYTYYIPLQNVTVGSILLVKGTFIGTHEDSIGYQFTVSDFYRTWDGSKWDYVLEDYDVVSLADANLPTFANTNNNTDGLYGGEAAFVTDPAGLPKKIGFFGLTNETSSYAFQFKINKSARGGGWHRVLIGGSADLYRSGHFFEFSFYDDDHEGGYGWIKEMTGKGDNWAANTVHDAGGFQLYWNETGQDNIIELGVVKLKHSTLHNVFFKVNGNVRFSDAWELAEGARTTKVSFINATNATISNSIEPSSTKLSPSTYVPASKFLYFNMAEDICPVVNNWQYYFMPVNADSLKFNGENIGDGHWNFFKKTGAQQMFIDLNTLGLTPVSGDILYVSGMFKAAKLVEEGDKWVLDADNPVLFKLNFEEGYFQFDGEAWNAVNPDYTAVKFAKDVLKETLAVCSAGTSNHDALVAIWEGLAEAYSSLVIDQKALVVGADSDTGDVPVTTVEDIEALDDEDALAFGMGRYDYCTAKYSLTNFVTGRDPSPAYPSIRTLGVTSNTTTILIIILSTAALLVAGGYFILHRRKEER